MLKSLSLLIASTLILTGCINRERSDERLANGCAAGAEIFLDEGFKIKEITEKKFRDAPGLGKGYREATIKVIESDGWYEGDETYQCIFIEEIGGLSGYRATLYQIRFRDEVFGKEGDKILGSMSDWLNLTEAVEKKMNQH